MQDIAEIWTFGFENWGEWQADHYSGMIRHVLSGLLDYPFSGSPYPGRHKGLRSIKAGQHRIVYRYDDQVIEVFRILHARMDAARHLG